MFKHAGWSICLLAPIVVASGHVLDRAAKAACTSDNCYRAVQHTTGFASGRGGTYDCSTYMTATITPAVSTVFVTVTSTSSVINTVQETDLAKFTSSTTDSTTITTSITDTATTIISSANTETSTSTSTLSTTAIDTSTAITTGTSTVTSFITSTTTKSGLRIITYSTVSAGLGIADRRQVIQPSPATIPVYASSACASGGLITSRYLSACSCLGVTAHGSTTIPARTTTLTVYATISSSITVVQSTTVSTTALETAVTLLTSTDLDQETVTSTTVSTDTTTIAATVTDVTHVTTTLTLTQTNSETTTVSSTATLTAIASCSQFAIQLASGPRTGWYVYAKASDSSVTYSASDFRDNSAESSVWRLDKYGRLVTFKGYTLWSQTSALSVFYSMSESTGIQAAPFRYAALACSVADSGSLTCTNGLAKQFCTNDSPYGSLYLSQVCSGSNYQVLFKATCL